MKILISLLCILAYIGIGYLVSRMILRDQEYRYDILSDEILSTVLIWPIIVLITILLIIGYYGTILFVKIYRGIIKR